MDEPERHQLGERLFDLRAQQAGRVDDLVEERRAVALQMLDHLATRADLSPAAPPEPAPRDSTGRGCAAAPA